MNDKQKKLEAELIQCWRELDEQILGLKGADFYSARTANDVIMIVRPLFDKIFIAGFELLADPVPREELRKAWNAKVAAVWVAYPASFEFGYIDEPLAEDLWPVIEAILDGKEIK